MTRETKIGLLVGLAFIIVIGVLLSDHLTTRGELPQAQLTQVGESVRQASAVPTSTTPPIAPVTVPTNVTPVNTVPTHDELNQRPSTAIVQVGPSKGPSTNGLTPAISVDVNAAQAGANEAPVLTAPTKDSGSIGQSLIAVAGTTGNPAEEMKAVQPNQPLQVAANPSLKAVKAEKGDTVSRLASKYLGANTSTNRQAIIDANPVLKANPAKMVIGHTYMIPTKSATAEAPAKTPAAVATADNVATPGPLEPVALTNATEPATLTTTPPVAKAELVVKAETKKATAATSSYKVKTNDTLWGIASSQLGDGTLVKEIKDMNKDVLKGKDVLRAGMTLKLPAKQSVASR